MANRLTKLFRIDSSLNLVNIGWKIVLQTNCSNDEQVDKMYHGVAISYRNKQDTIPTVEAKTDSALSSSKETPDLANAYGKLNLVPNEVLAGLEGLDEIKRKERLIDYFEKTLEDSVEQKINASTLKDRINTTWSFIDYFGDPEDKSVLNILDRNKDWDRSLVVADWTGSMYQFGAQALIWHMMNFETSGMSYLSLFNDGDDKNTSRKKIGTTEGIYYEKAGNLDRILNLYQLVMLKGSGGDGPENDLEAILRAVEKYPDHGDLILIADNNACVRDMELLDMIDEPVRVVLCGYTDMYGINPQYIEIARKTGGSIHTMELDLHNLEVKLGKDDEILSLVDVLLKVGHIPCNNPGSLYLGNFEDAPEFDDLALALKKKKEVFKLFLPNKGFEKAPKSIKKFKHLRHLDLSDNNISELSGTILSLEHLNIINLSGNKISEIPKKIFKLPGLKKIDLNNNNISEVPVALGYLRYLKYLDLSQNKISTLPPSVNYTYLQYLFLSQNEISEFPLGIFRMRKLVKLDLGHNALTKIPKKISTLRKLEVLDISHNQLTELPVSISKMKKLKRVILSGNPFTPEKLEALKKSMPKVVIEFQ